MAWDARRRRADSIPWNLRRSESGVDELDLKRSNSFSTRVDRKMDIETPLSPIQEEKEPETCSAPLQVNLTIRFFDPVVRSVYHRTYSSSQSFVPTDQICRGMLRRIEHCSEELITRKDSGALTPIQCLRKGPKDLRFEMSFQIFRKGHSGAWAERTFESYQKQPLTSDSAMDLLRCTHSIIGIFLRRHDDRFRWIDEPSREYFPEKPATFKPSLTGPPNLSCVPRSRFVEYTQKWEVVPGYALELTFESRNPTRRQPDIRKVLKVGSTQTAPLTLGLGEDLLWQAHRAVEYVLDSRKEAFDIEHANCEGLDGVSDCGCQHFDEDALKVELRPVNNLGPTYEHLYRNIRSRLRLFEHPTGRDCDEFIASVRSRFHQLRDGTDKKLEMLNDFDFRIADLIGHGWHVKNPAHFVLDGTRRRTRRSIEALLDRIRTGVGDVLRGHDVAIRMIAYSRGHLILDKALISRNHQSSPDHIASMVPEDEQKITIQEEAQQSSEDNTETRLAMSGDMTIDSALHPITVPDLEAAGVAGTDREENTQDDLPVEGWLLHSDEAEDEEEPVPLADLGEPEGMIDVDQCGSSKVSEPHIEETTTAQETNTAVFELLSHVVTEQVNAVASPASTEADKQVLSPLGGVEDVTLSSGSAETSRVGFDEVSFRDEDQCEDSVGDLPIGSKMSASGDDDLEENPDSDNAESFQPQDPLGVSVTTESDSRRNSVPEVLEDSHVEPFSESVIDVGEVAEATEPTISEIEEETELGQNEGSTSEVSSDSSGVLITGLQTHAIETEATSELLDVTNVREGASNALICVKDHVSILVPTLPRDQAASEVTSPLAWNRDITQPSQSPRPTLTHLGLGNGYLQRLSPFARFSTGINKSSSSLSSSSEWEDYASEAHQSSDSVNTVGLAPSPSEQDDDLLQVPLAPRRVGKPTAGLLGLQDSRRDNFGIRGALTGTHAFDRAPVTSLPSSPRYEAHDEHLKSRTDTVENGVKTQRKRPSSSNQRLVHLRHNKSNGSVVFPGAQVKSPKMNRKESKEPKVRERNKPTGEENSKPVVVEHRIDDSEGRFPRAMAIVAGLAMFSSMVNANPA
ncbi:hypothetical protein VPNG_00134 [Cytospora leucostoma]|uniref:Pt repeat family protein n=1 Tax=Cytospora leucostoma TaxID=1230097 RepID=A0A423XNI5_9PEZI|nr:hypothetical protein VPNG_00134 [Cytospora leucostoma]